MAPAAGYQRAATRKNIIGGIYAGKWYHGMEMGYNKLVNNLYSSLPPSTSRSNKSAIADTGASGHYLQDDFPHDISLRPTSPIKVKKLNG